MIESLLRRLRCLLTWMFARGSSVVPVPPLVPAHVPLVPHRMHGFRGADPPDVQARTTWRNACSAATAMAKAYPGDPVVQRYCQEVMRSYERLNVGASRVGYVVATSPTTRPSDAATTGLRV